MASSLLKEPELEGVLVSMENLNDPSTFEWQDDLVGYINDSCGNNDDMFFYDMLPFMRFVRDKDATAWTDPYMMMYFNAPYSQIAGRNIAQWEFIYCHECLHQLWDTFAVGDEIKAKKIECDHNLLNIASDCVINDYLSAIRHKNMPANIITPEYLKDGFGVEYNRKEDTQFTLYLKLLKVKEQMLKDPRIKKMLEDMEKEGNSGSGGGGGMSVPSGSKSNSQKGGGGKGASGKQDSDIDKMSGDEAAEAAQEAADAAADAASKSGDSKAKKAAKEAQDAADAAADAAAKGDTKTARKKAKEAREKAREAGADGDDGKGGQGQGHSGTGKGKFTNEDYRKQAKKVIDKYKNKLSGALGEFVSKCNSSKKLEDDSLKGKNDSGSTKWNQTLEVEIIGFVKQRIQQKKREFENTYKKVKRGSGYIKYGSPIQPGHRIRKDGIVLDFAFWIDRSGSMEGDPVKNASATTFNISKSIQRIYDREPLVDEIKSDFYAWDTVVEKIKFGQVPKAYGGTMNIDELFGEIEKISKDYMVNVIITDGGFSVDQAVATKFLKSLPGLFIVVCNSHQEECVQLEKKNRLNFVYIEADNDFTYK